MAEYKDAFNKNGLRIAGDGQYVSFKVDDGEAYMECIVDITTFREIMKELNTLTWVLHG